jgi:uncharacterized protein (DUF488 family)
LIYTIGHSTRSAEEFLELLKLHSIELLIDVRTIPRSGRNPQFNTNALADSLANAGIGYLHMPELGGLRKPRKDSINLAWKNPGFRGYADYMQTAQFEKGLTRAIQLSNKQTVTLMCAEAFYAKCHRMLLSDALVAHEVEVVHIVSKTQTQSHVLTRFAKVQGTRITYPLPQSQLEF